MRHEMQAWIQNMTAPILLPQNVVHIWKANLRDSKLLTKCSAVLSNDELKRAASMSNVSERLRFQTCRVCLRDILSRYLGTVQPGELRFGACRNGKPKLRHPDRDVRFNVSHTGDAGVIAVALGREVGVDIERLDRRIRNVGKLMEARLTPHEQLFVRRKAGDRIDASHGDSLRGEFIKMWTRKEAFVKCTGEGIARGLKTFEIVDDVLVDIIDGMKASDGDWSVIDLNIGEDHVGTVVTEGSGLSVVKVEYRMDA